MTTAGVSDEVAQELQMPMGPQMLEDVEEQMLARPPTLRDPGTPDQIVMEQRILTHFRVNPGARCASNPEDTIHHIENSGKSMQLWVHERWRPSTDSMLPCGNRHLFWSHPRDDGAGLQENGHA